MGEATTVSLASAEVHQHVAHTADYVLVHLVAGEAMTPLVASQVVDHAEAQASADGAGRPWRVAVGILEPVRVALRAALRARVREFARRAPHVRVHIFPFVSRWRRLSVLWVAARLRQLAGRRPIVMHCRGEDAVLWASELADRLRRRGRRVGIVADIRGAWPDELLLQYGFDGPTGAPSSVLDAYTINLNRLRQALERANRVMTVSNPLAEWLESHGAPVEAITVVPCSVSRVAYSAEVRAAARRALGFANDALVLAYVGSIAPYQHVEDGALQFARECALANPRVRFLALTNDVRGFQELIARADFPESLGTVMSVPQDSVAGYLCAADAGLLLRAPSRVNEVSMPVKLGEYLACGVPVIVSRIPGWVDEIVDGAGAGIAVSWFGTAAPDRAREAARALDLLRNDAVGYRQRALALCRERFVWTAHTARVREAYVGSLAE